MPRKRPASYHHGDLRSALLAAALTMLKRTGPGALSLREVARKAGVSHQAPYHHFANREQLLAALAVDQQVPFRGTALESAARDVTERLWLGIRDAIR